MPKKILLCLIVISCIFLSKRSRAQTSIGDTTGQQVALTRITDAYNKAIGQQSRLYNGQEHNPYSLNIQGTAYFSDVNGFNPGTVTYDGFFYKDVPMMYDLYKDVVVVLLYNKFSTYCLINERVQSFDLLNHHFVYIVADSLNVKAGINTGFYDQLYNSNNSAVLVKRSKSIQSTSSSNTIETFFTSSKSFYLRKGNTYYSISSQSSLLAILKDKKKDLQQYIRANKIKFRKAPEETMVAIVNRYDELSR